MIEVPLREGDEFIKLGQALKKAGAVSMGADAKFVIEEGMVLVNGETENRRGRKLYHGDTFSYEGETYIVNDKNNLSFTIIGSETP